MENNTNTQSTQPEKSPQSVAQPVVNGVPQKKIVNSRKRYDWPTLRREFVSGTWPTLSEFKRQKGLTGITDARYFTGWLKDRIEYQRKLTDRAMQRSADRAAESIQDTKERQAKLARFLQLVGTKKIQTAKEDEISVEEARKMVIYGMQEERKAIGLENTLPGGAVYNQFNTFIAKTNLDKRIQDMDYEGVLRLIAEVRRERLRRDGAVSTEERPGQIEEGETV